MRVRSVIIGLDKDAEIQLAHLTGRRQGNGEVLTARSYNENTRLLNIPSYSLENSFGTLKPLVGGRRQFDFEAINLCEGLYAELPALEGLSA